MLSLRFKSIKCLHFRGSNFVRFASQNKGFVDLFEPEGGMKAPPKEFDHFKLFGLDRSFNIDTVLLAQVYKSLQRQLHPDKFSLKSTEDKQLSDTWSSLVNDGYNSLLKPLPRALYLLDLLEMPLQEGTIDIEPTFLMEMMDLNEEILEADRDEIISLGEDVRNRIGGYVEKIEAAFKSGKIEEARDEVAHMKYLTNILDKIIQIETDLQID